MKNLRNHLQSQRKYLQSQRIHRESQTNHRGFTVLSLYYHRGITEKCGSANLYFSAFEAEQGFKFIFGNHIAFDYLVTKAKIRGQIIEGVYLGCRLG